jgi:hypothetical protein
VCLLVIFCVLSLLRWRWKREDWARSRRRLFRSDVHALNTLRDFEQSYKHRESALVTRDLVVEGRTAVVARNRLRRFSLPPCSTLLVLAAQSNSLNERPRDESRRRFDRPQLAVRALSTGARNTPPSRGASKSSREGGSQK